MLKSLLVTVIICVGQSQVIGTHPTSVRLRDFTCDIEGQAWKVHCNTCWCSQGKISICTIAGCLPGGNKTPIPITPKTENKNSDFTCAIEGQAWKVDCNTCRCSQGKLSICTRAECSPGGNKTPLPITPKTEKNFSDFTCDVEREVWKVGCNVCWCNEGRLNFCTKMKCAPGGDTTPKKIKS